MATWTRNGTGTYPSAIDAVVAGTIELDNGTAPGDFDPDAVNSVRLQWTAQIQSGTFESGGGEYHQVFGAAAALTLNGNGTVIATATASDGTLDDGTINSAPVALDSTDSTIATGFTAAQWELMELNDAGHIADIWTAYFQNKGKDGVTVEIVSAIVTIDYTPSSSDASGSGAETSNSSGTSTGQGDRSGSGAETSNSSESSTGQGDRSGSGAETSNSSGTSTGVATLEISGSGAETSNSSGTSTGLPGKSGLGAETSNSSGTSTGQGDRSGTGAETSNSSESSTGQGDRSGSGAETSNSTGAATGFPPTADRSGSGSETSNSSGTTTGQGDRSGTGAETSNSTGTSTGLPGKSGLGAETSNSTGTSTGLPGKSGLGAETSNSTGAATGVQSFDFAGTGSETSNSSESSTGFNARFGTGAETSNSTGTYSTAGSPLDNTLDTVISPLAMTATATAHEVLVQLAPLNHYAEARP